MIYLNTSTSVFCIGLKYPDYLGGAYINDSALVTGKIYDIADTLIASFSLVYIPASNGNYHGQITRGVSNTLTQYAEYQVAVFYDSNEIYRERHIADYLGD